MNCVLATPDVGVVEYVVIEYEPKRAILVEMSPFCQKYYV